MHARALEDVIAMKHQHMLVTNSITYKGRQLWGYWHDCWHYEFNYTQLAGVNGS